VEQRTDRTGKPVWLKKAASRAWVKRTIPISSIPFVPLVVGTFFFTGLSPAASGTVGSLAAALLYYFIPELQNNGILIAAIVVVFFAGVWASNVIERVVEEHDPGIIVADEAIGQWIALISVTYVGDPIFTAVAFLAFRFFDIIKLYPASAVEKRTGGWAVMGDDAIAGVYANLAAHGATWIIHRFLL
jgi:phosphatidylglycerophosphatase A